MQQREMTHAVLEFHRAAEELNHAAGRALADNRFVFSLEESRKLRDLVLDAWTLSDGAERKMLSVPIEVAKSKKINVVKSGM